MYDSHIFCREYKDLKDQIVNIVNGDTEDYDIDALAEHIQELYDDGEMSSSQYDDLMSYVQDLGQFTRNYTQTTKRGLLTTNKG